MAAEAQCAPTTRDQTNFARPPRMPVYRSSLAAAAADLIVRDAMAAAWVSAWMDLGGVVVSDTDGNRFVGWPHGDADLSGAPGADWSIEQAAGARRILITMLETAGLDALGSVFTVGLRRA